MTYDKQDLLRDLRLLAAKNADDCERNHIDADDALIRYIDDPQIALAYEAISRWYA